MLKRIKQLIAGSKILQLILIFLLGMIIGVVFYPTKHIETKLTKIHQEEIATLKEQHQKELSVEHDKYSKLETNSKEYHVQSELNISKLTTQVSTLKSKQKTSYYKLVKPDGTVEIKKFTESEVDESTKVVTSIQEEFKQKIDSIEKKWESIHKDRVAEIQKDFSSKEETYKKTIDELQKSKVVDINKKSFGLEAGALLNGNYYGHVTYDVLGPLFLGLHSQLGTSPTGGAGIGIRF
jgi:hypothetical protein